MNFNFLLWTPGAGEVIVILAIVVLLFGAKKIPELMKGVGKGIKEFKKATSQDADPDDEQSSGKTGNLPE